MRFRVSIALAVGFLAGSSPARAQVLPAPEPLAIVGATIYPSPDAQPIADGVVRIENGKIAAVGPAHARGLVLVPGFWNSHVHFVERKWADPGSISAEELNAQLRDMLTQWGFTTVFDTGSNLDNTLAIRGRIESGEVMGPRIVLLEGDPARDVAAFAQVRTTFRGGRVIWEAVTE